ncbi:MAG: UDP-N-acetylmuramate--L-alanine ligase [Pauljensenia sp.]|uniref:UDP-N-acetylmuramate--L-alanine ligase n=1 Tax=Actinomyces sp. oral taxon 180 TaxID=651609 RepID=UPI0001F10419|nr:UDP-N-acetylmuramate--L-alanine ligase [Actinomyces sp. oral taxon 180]EFU62179.1 UDP-N-acetylmuramate--L-alanine ligase [Actinomyces sp. oral taxon 180 str. F0310]
MSEPSLQDRFHLIGVGGAGMSVVAELLVSRGAVVAGSDREESQVLDHLRSVGVHVDVGHDASHVDPEAVVVVSSAIREDNPELAVARRRGQLVIHRSQALALAASGMRFVAVAGAHGKTSTSGMLAIALRACGLDPSVAVGGVLPQLGTGAHLGGGEVFVAEADESDGSFLNYSPAIEIVTNVEPDHLDRYHSREEFEEIFVEFVRRLVPGGLLVACAEDPGAARLADTAKSLGARVVTYGREEHSQCEADVLICDVSVDAEGASASLAWGPRRARLRLAVPGEHHVLNAAAAWVAGIECGVEPQAMADGLGTYAGAARRFESRGAVGGRRLFDDYAHHPTEVEAAIEQARVVAAGGEVTVVFQPHLYSRTRIFAERFASALSRADHVVLAGIYGAREDPEPGVDSGMIASRVVGASYAEDMHEAARRAARLTPRGGVCVTMGAGSITRCGQDVLDEWKRMDS